MAKNHWIYVVFFFSTQLSFAGAMYPNGPQITGNSSDHVVLTWCSIANGCLTAKEAMYSGGSWGASAIVSCGHSATLYPKVAMNGNGDILFAWQEYLSGFQVGIASTSFGTPPDGYKILTTTTGYYPAAALNASGEGLVFWHRDPTASEGVGCASCPQLSTDCTLTSHDPSGVSPLMPAVAICQTTGDAMVVLQEYADQRMSALIQAIPIPSGDTWGTPVTVSSAGVYSSNPSVIYGDSGEALVLWQEPVNDNVGISVVSYSDGSWGSIQTFSSSGYNITEADIAMNADGTSVLLVALSSNGTDSSIVYAQRTEGVWSALSTLSQDPSATAANPKISISATGGPVAAAVWDVTTSSNVREIRASCFISGSWGDPAVISGDDSSTNKEKPVVWVSHAGASAVAAWRVVGSHTIAIDSATYSFDSNAWSAPSTVSEDG